MILALYTRCSSVCVFYVLLLLLQLQLLLLIIIDAGDHYCSVFYMC